MKVVDPLAGCCARLREERTAPVRRNKAQDVIGIIRRIAREVNSGDDGAEQTRSKDYDADVRSLKVPVEPRHGARLDGVEDTETVVVAGEATESMEVRI